MAASTTDPPDARILQAARVAAGSPVETAARAPVTSLTFEMLTSQAFPKYAAPPLDIRTF